MGNTEYCKWSARPLEMHPLMAPTLSFIFIQASQKSTSLTANCTLRVMCQITNFRCPGPIGLQQQDQSPASISTGNAADEERLRQHAYLD